ncbi:hypothetical protein DESC_970031 [Desulfosarcina cetonica]|nr:hypothetical protein DESC_970031 [Desulfosarcina cetonica]
MGKALEWSGREDLNLRLPAPKAGALPDCATPRFLVALLPLFAGLVQALNEVLSPGSGDFWKWLET